MKTVEFCYWLQGVFEMSEVSSLDEKQTATLKRHLDMVFEHIAHLEEKTNRKSTRNQLLQQGELS